MSRPDVGMYRVSSCVHVAARLTAEHSARTIRSPQLKRICLVPRAYGASAREKDKEQLLRGVTVECRDDVARILDQAQRADASWEVVFTDFYPPPVITDAVAVIKKMPEIACKAWGGYPQAERTRLVIAKAEMLADDAQMSAVSAVQIKGNFLFDSANHRDFLGATMGCGIERSKVGDIIVQGEQGAQILLVAELVQHVEMSLTQVRSVPVTTRGIELAELAVKDVKKVSLRPTFEASMRLDAIASAGFSTSRSKIVNLIKAGDIRLNWKEAKASSVVASGDLISCRGKGRVEVTAVEMTKKDRYAVHMDRYT